MIAIIVREMIYKTRGRIPLIIKNFNITDKYYKHNSMINRNPHLPNKNNKLLIPNKQILERKLNSKILFPIVYIKVNLVKTFHFMKWDL